MSIKEARRLSQAQRSKWWHIVHRLDQLVLISKLKKHWVEHDSNLSKVKIKLIKEKL
jgi:hypothetical protein